MSSYLAKYGTPVSIDAISKLNEHGLYTLIHNHALRPTFFAPGDLKPLQDTKLTGGQLIQLSTAQLVQIGFPMKTALLLKKMMEILTSPDVARSRDVALPMVLASAPNEFRIWCEETFKLAKSSPRDSDKIYSQMKMSQVAMFTPRDLRSERFSMDDAGTKFTYYGRRLFRTLSKRVNHMRKKGGRFLYLHGTTGAGKSHVLAAYATSLVARGERVVYLGDCRLLAPEPISLIREALCLAYTDDENMFWWIYYKVVDKDSLYDVCRKIGHKKLIFIIDQVNALDTVDDSSDKVTESQKEFTRTILDTITRSQFKIHSASGNYRHGEGDRLRAAGHQMLSAYGGLDKDEARAWWDSKDLGGRWGELLQPEQQEQFRSYTDMVPALLSVVAAAPVEEFATMQETKAARQGETLDPALMDPLLISKSAYEYLVTVLEGSDVVGFWREMIGKCVLQDIQERRDTTREEPYYRALECCLTEMISDEDAWSQIDQRFLYIENEVGHCSGGLLVRRMFSSYLRFRSITIFSGTRWYDALASSDNPSVLGFLVESTILSWIASYDCGMIGLDLKKLQTTTFHGIVPPLDYGNHVLAIPGKWNYPFVDAISWRVTEKTENDGTINVQFGGIQVTIGDRKSHSTAEGPFLALAAQWCRDRGWIPEFDFIWLLEKREHTDKITEPISEETEDQYQKRYQAEERKLLKAAEAKREKLEAARAKARKEGMPFDEDEEMPDAKLETEVKIHGRRPAFTRRIYTINEISPTIGFKLKLAREAALRREPQGVHIPRYNSDFGSLMDIDTEPEPERQVKAREMIRTGAIIRTPSIPSDLQHGGGAYPPIDPYTSTLSQPLGPNPFAQPPNVPGGSIQVPSDVRTLTGGVQRPKRTSAAATQSNPYPQKNPPPKPRGKPESLRKPSHTQPPDQTG